ncbi:MAG: X-Pro dipeptidyl-peptidase [Natronomonas sp.]|jgi:X-Pro dipeptidyl-peptidase
MDEPTFDRRSLLQTTGALVGASALGMFGSGAAAAETEAATVETTAGKTTAQFDKSDPQEIYVDLEMTFENHEGEKVTETPTLYGEVIRPVDDDGDFVENVPVILTYTPYGDLYKPLNGGDSTATDGIADYFVPRGYARVVVDLIGCRNSDGYYDYGGIRERLSGKQLVEDLAGHTWTNGNVGMIGGSYDGTTQFATAIEAPTGLKAIVPQVAIDRWYDYRHFGGVPRSTVGTPTLFDFGFAAVPPRAKDRPAHNVDVATTRVQPSRRAEFERRSYEYNSNYDDFWVEREYRQHADNVPDDCAVMIEGGWEDRNVIRWGSTRFYEALKAEGHEKRRLVMGDWPHAAGQYPDSTDLYHALYDQFLLTGDEDWHDVADTSTGIMDLPEVDVQSASAPRTQFGTWPPEGAGTQRLPFVRDRDDVDGLALGLVGTSLNTWEDASPPPAESDFFEERGSGDKYLMFETEELGSDLRFTGHVTADLLAASSADTWYTAVVYERDPDDGSVRPFSRGAWNSRFRNGEQTESDTPTDEAYRVGVETWDINWRVSEGNRLGVIIASDNDDYVRHDPRNESTNQLILGDSTLRFDGFAEGLDTVEFPNVTLSREIDRANGAGGEEVSAHFAGWTARCTVTVDAASDDVSVRVPIPDGWEVVGGDDYDTETVSGTTYVVFAEPASEGDERTVLLSAPDETGEYPFGPVEYSAAKELWATADGTAETAVVIGVETTV